MTYSLKINGKKPTVLQGVTLTQERKGSPAKLEFEYYAGAGADAVAVDFGDAVRFQVKDGDEWAKVFAGRVYTLKTSESKRVNVTAYDSLRTLKNKDTYNIKGKTASAIVRQICADFELKAGEIEKTSYVIPQWLAKNKTLFDIILTALEAEVTYTGTLYTLYDDYGSICLKKPQSMRVPIVVNSTTAQSYDYTASIDGETYNRIKLVYENKKEQTNDFYKQEDTVNIKKWGILQLLDSLKEGENGKVKAALMLELYNAPQKTFEIKGVYGDTRVRGGSLIGVKIATALQEVSKYMLVEKVAHKFGAVYTMDVSVAEVSK